MPTAARTNKHENAPFLFRLGSGEEALDLASYGLTWIEKTWEASWSPDGRHLAWGGMGKREGVHYAAEVLLNLANNTHMLLHQYQPRMGGGIPAPRWARDGGWLTFMALDLNRGAGGLWWFHLESGVAEQLSPYFIRRLAPGGADLSR